MSSRKRPRETDGAKKLLNQFMIETSWQIHHEAERYMLEEHRTEITEQDVKKAISQKAVGPSTKRKWAVRIVLVFFFALTVAQISAIAELSSLSVWSQIRLYILPIFALVWVVCFSYFFREYWV